MDKLYTELLSKVKEHRYTLVTNTVKEENSFSISGEKASIPFFSRSTKGRHRQVSSTYSNRREANYYTRIYY